MPEFRENRMEKTVETPLEKFSRMASESLAKTCSEFELTTEPKKQPVIELDDTMTGMGRCDYKQGVIKFNPAKITKDNYSVQEIVDHEMLHWVDNDFELQGSNPYSHLLHCLKFPGEGERRLKMAECSDFNIDGTCSEENIRNLEQRAQAIMEKLGGNVDDMITNETDSQTILELFFLISAVDCLKEVYFSRKLADNNDPKKALGFMKKRDESIRKGDIKIFSPSAALGSFADFDGEMALLEKVVAADE